MQGDVHPRFITASAVAEAMAGQVAEWQTARFFLLFLKNEKTSLSARFAAGGEENNYLFKSAARKGFDGANIN